MSLTCLNPTRPHSREYGSRDEEQRHKLGNTDWWYRGDWWRLRPAAATSTAHVGNDSGCGVQGHEATQALSKASEDPVPFLGRDRRAPGHVVARFRGQPQQPCWADANHVEGHGGGAVTPRRTRPEGASPTDQSGRCLRSPTARIRESPGRSAPQGGLGALELLGRCAAPGAPGAGRRRARRHHHPMEAGSPAVSFVPVPSPGIV
jgi:hypothetical protein